MCGLDLPKLMGQNPGKFEQHFFVHANFGEVGRHRYKEAILWMFCCS
jgi:hypothetical protein